jgi:hypothetical protein
MKTAIGVLVLCLLTGACLQEPRILDYRLTETLPDRDFDYAWLGDIDSVPPPYPLNGEHQIGDLKTIPGDHTIYKFIREYKPESWPAESPEKLHDLLMIKTDGRGNVLDAYHYTLEWSDSPSLDLYGMSAKGLNLKRQLTIADFEFKNSQGLPLR